LSVIFVCYFCLLFLSVIFGSTFLKGGFKG
jgi:hypothetical protein